MSSEAVDSSVDEQGQDTHAMSISDDEQDGEESVEVEHAPPRLSQYIALLAAILGAVLIAPFRLLAIPFVLSGIALFAAGLFRTYSRGWLSMGTGLILTGALIVGAYGPLPPVLMMIASGSTLIAWDAGQHAIGIGEQLGRQTQTRRVELVHVAISTMVVGFITTLALVVFLLGGGGRPAPAVAIAVVGIVIMIWLFRN